ncbi:MAG TPA: hypothetical protein VFV37_07475 [Luteibaculaceae bacterium]|nr:hypothetical protein [Luteibaculaceae bacterium]
MRLKRSTGVVGLVGLSLYLAVACSGSGPEKEKTSHQQGHPVELVALMGRMQVYVNKLYFAGKAENKALFQFYLREINEAMDEIVQGGVSMDGMNVSANMKAFGVPSVQVIEKRIGAEGFVNFEEHYANLITACNSCHKVSQRGYIEMTVPKTPVFDNQNYTKGEFSDMAVDTDGD